METWLGVFKLTPDAALTLREWLGQRLKPPCSADMGHAGRICIEGPDRDSLFKTCEWIRHQNPLGRKLDYSVIGYKGKDIIWLSYCPKCRKGEGPHHLHG